MKMDIKIPSAPYFGTKVVHNNTAPQNSMVMEISTTAFTRWVTSKKVVEFRDSWASCIFRSPNFLPIATLKKVVKVIRPSPPIWISSKMTILPNIDHLMYVSNTIKPVTQVALVAVKRQSKKLVACPSLELMGSIRRSVPAKITMAKLMAIIRIGSEAECRLLCTFKGI